MLTSREKAIKRDRKKEWVHYIFRGHPPMLLRIDGKTTACGKSARRIRGTTTESHVTCPRCIEALKDMES